MTTDQSTDLTITLTVDERRMIGRALEVVENWMRPEGVPPNPERQALRERIERGLEQ